MKAEYLAWCYNCALGIFSAVTILTQCMSKHTPNYRKIARISDDMFNNAIRRKKGSCYRKRNSSDKVNAQSAIVKRCLKNHFHVEKIIFLSKNLVHISHYRFQPVRDLEPMLV